MKIKFIMILFSGILISMLACETSTSNQKSSTEKEQEVYLAKGKAIAGATFSALSEKLKAALKEGGVANAVQYCNLAAMPLVDSLSKVHHAQIRRTSTKVRNPLDKPTLDERLILDIYEKKELAGEPLQPMVRSGEDDTTIAFYAPIHTISFCLQCHGKVGETLKTEDDDLIKKLYPKDKAIGYVEGDFRGMWSIQFSKEKK